jgi:hypothetical protein
MLDPNKIKTYPLKSRFSKVRSRDFARPPAKGRSFAAFYDSLPQILKASDLKAVAEAVAKARKAQKAVIFMAGAHVIKCGLNPVVIELLRKKVITCLCLNGAGIIHDFELAFQGRTSEDVAENLKSGKFGMGRETAEFLNQAVNDGVRDGLGLGKAVASRIAAAKLPHKNLSLLYQAYQHKVPVCVFVAIGTDIIHQHPNFDAAAAGEGCLRDFHLLTENVAGLNKGGVVLNFGSAVIMPEVFLKALNLARNLGHRVKDFTAANFDMIYHYRPQQNIVARPVSSGGKGYYFIGHHEIMLPLLAQAVIEKL